MKIAVAADHAGYPLKQAVLDDLRGAGHEATDFGTHNTMLADDYPDFAALACERYGGVTWTAPSSSAAAASASR
jgi:ribose 5-phosphate isomerase B